MDIEQVKVAVRILDSFCACVDPCLEDVIALRLMAESRKEERMRISELACAVIDRHRARFEAAGLPLPRFTL